MNAVYSTIAALYRYPVKGLSPQAEARLVLTVPAGLADDRRFALTLGTTVFDPADPTAGQGSLADVATQRGPGRTVDALRSRGRSLVDRHPMARRLVADLGTLDGRATVEGFFDAYLGSACQGGTRLVEAAGHKFTDVGHVSPALMKAVSVISLASVRDLARRSGLTSDPLRFRANIYLRGLPA